jgi:rhodanese-related sulfurtransferase
MMTATTDTTTTTTTNAAAATATALTSDSDTTEGLCSTTTTTTTSAAAEEEAIELPLQHTTTTTTTTTTEEFDKLAINEALSSTQGYQQTEVELKNQLKLERLAINKKMVHKYQSQFPQIPTMTSEELVERWKQQDREDDVRDDYSQQSQCDESDSSSINSDEHASQSNSPESFIKRNNKVGGPLLLLDVRSKSERTVSIIPGACTMDDLETTRWINKYVHNFEGTQLGFCGGIPTIVMYCTIGYRSGREAQRLYDDLTTTFDIDINSVNPQVEIKNLDGILAYSFVDFAPPLMYPATSDGGSDYHMTKRIHSFGKEWSIACNPEYDVVYFQKKSKLCKHLLQTGFVSAVRGIQHLISKSTKKVKETKVIKNVCIEPLPVLNIGIPRLLGGNGSHSTTDLSALDNHNHNHNNNNVNTTDLNTLKRISLTGYTTNVNAATTDTCTVATTTSNNTNTNTCGGANNNSNNNNMSTTTTATNEVAVRGLYYVP